MFSSKFILTFVFYVLKFENQVVSLIPIFFFHHNFYLATPNGECDLISNIFTLIPFQWYIVGGGENLNQVYYLHFCPKFLEFLGF
jgi:hypothetical protein